jgi:hypothetical protein
MATRSRKTSLEETPIKHTAGGEMPDPSEQHHVDAEELEALGGVEGVESSSFFDQAKTYLPYVLGTVGIGLGIYFLVRKGNWGEWTNWQNWKNRVSEAKDEAQRAMDIDDVQPSRLMGA